MNGRFARADELWIAWASKVLPVPVSPSSTTGTSDFAASVANWRQRAIASLLVVRSSSLNLDGRSFISRYCFMLSVTAESVQRHIHQPLPAGARRPSFQRALIVSSSKSCLDSELLARKVVIQPTLRH